MTGRRSASDGAPSADRLVRLPRSADWLAATRCGDLQAAWMFRDKPQFIALEKDEFSSITGVSSDKGLQEKQIIDLPKSKGGEAHSLGILPKKW